MNGGEDTIVRSKLLQTSWSLKHLQSQMEVAEMDEALKVLESSLSLIKWRLKSPTKRRLEIGSFPFSPSHPPNTVFLLLYIYIYIYIYSL